MKGAIPRQLRPALGNRVFGCDDCQDVCPINSGPAPRGDDAYLGAAHGRHLLELATLDAAGFRRRFRHTPVWRSRYRGFMRNLMVALGNWGDPRARTALAAGLAHAEPLVREHAAWGLGQLGGAASRTVLARHLPGEENAQVAGEISLSLRELASPGVT